MAKRDYYDILGVSKTSSDDEIKKAYRKLALKYHPDRNPGDKEAEENFKEAAEAYEALGDPEKRALYDRFGHAGLSGSGWHPFSDVDDVFSSFGDIFEDFFGFGPSRRARTQARRGRDLGVELALTFEEACFGVEKKIDVNRHEQCTECKGEGMAPGSSRTTCPTCRGQGKVGRTQGFFTVTATCHECHGEGSIISDPCRACRGQGKVATRKKLTVKVPPGVDDGIRLVLQGEGEAGERGGGPGDLYVILHVGSHERFERDGSTVYSEEGISITIAALGGEIEVETIDGKKKVRVPKGTETGDTIIIENCGVPALKAKSGAKRGDHVVRLLVRTPKHLTSRQEELLKEFAEIAGEMKETPKKKKKGFFS